MKKDEKLKREVLSEIQEKKITKEEAKEILKKFDENLKIEEIVEKKSVLKHKYLNKNYYSTRKLIYAGKIDNGKNGKDNVNIIINKIDIPLYFLNKKIKKTCHQNKMVAGGILKKGRFYGKKNNGIFVRDYGKTILGKKTVFSLKKVKIPKKKSRVEVLNNSNFLKNKLFDYFENTYLKSEFLTDENKDHLRNLLENNILKTFDKNGNVRNFIFKSKDFDIYNGYKFFDVVGTNLKEIYDVKNDFNLIIACDTEFINVVGNKNQEECFLLSCQFCFYWCGSVYTFTFLVNKKYSSKLSVKTFLQHILKYIDTNLFKINLRDNNTNRNFNLTLLQHFGRADMQHFKEFYDMFFKGLGLQIQGGLDTIKPFKYDIYYQNRRDREDLHYKVNVSIRDTMGYCSGEKTLLRQSAEQFFKKIEDKKANKSDMLGYLTKHTKDFLNYADMDALATLEIGYKFWGFNTVYPFTTGQSAVNDFIDSYMEKILGTSIENPKSLFRFLYNGAFKSNTETIELENGKLERNDVYTHTTLNITNLLKYYVDAYHGGLNQCYTRGYYTNKTIDYDLTSAYPTFMSCLPQANFLIDFDEFINISPAEALSKLQDYKEFNLAFGLVDWDFSKAHERYKNNGCIAQKINDNLVFCTTGKNGGVCGAELYRALEVNAITKVHKLIIPKYLKDEFVFKEYYKKTIMIRNKLKSKFGKKSVQQEGVKLKNNTPYGKTSQGLRQSKVSSYINKIKTVDLMPSSYLTNPIYASCITSLVSCYLNDVMALLRENKIKVHSVTTDGFITDVTSIDIINNLTKNDFIIGDFTNKVLNISREIQHNSELNTIWEVKHNNDSFFNLTTRGNFALNDGGVLACAGAKTLKNFKSRYRVLHYLMKYAGKVKDKFLKLTSLNEMLLNSEILSGVYIYKDNFTLEFDGKNIPILESSNVVEMMLKNKSYKILNFDTRQPYDLDEYKKIKDLLFKYKNATYNEDTFFKLMQEFNSSEDVKIGKVTSVKRSKNIEYLEAKNFLTNYISNNINTKIIKFFKTYTRQEIIEFININFLEHNNKKLTKNVYENIQKEIKKQIEAKKEIKRLEADYIELKILEHIKAKK